MSKNYNVIYIDLSTGQEFYSDRVIQSGIQIYKCEQTTNAYVWVLNHGLNTNKFILKITDSQNNIIEPLSVVVTDLNTITITFSQPTSGNVSLVLFGLSQSVVTPTPTVTPTSGCLTSYNETVLSKNPVAYWSFDTNLTDTVSGNIITPNSGNVSLIPDSYGNILEFQTGSKGTTLSQIINVSNNFSLEAWINVDSNAPAWSTIFGTEVYGFQINHNIIEGGESYTIYLYGNNDGIQFSTILPNTLYHIVLTIDSSGNAICYLNTVPTVGDSLSNDTYNFQHIGSDIQDSTDSYFLGTIGNPTIYNQALTSEQILENYNNGVNCYRYNSGPVPTPSVTPTITGTPAVTIPV